MVPGLAPALPLLLHHRAASEQFRLYVFIFVTHYILYSLHMQHTKLLHCARLCSKLYNKNAYAAQGCCS